MSNTRRIQAFRDADANVWWAKSDDIPGLVSEAPTLHELADRIEAVLPDLLAADGMPLNRFNLEFQTQLLA